MRPIAMLQSPHAVGFGMMVTPIAAKNRNMAEMPKKILPTVSSLKRLFYDVSLGGLHQ
jgi:hypothetical protein